MTTKTIVSAFAAIIAGGAFADFNLNLDLSGKPMRDLSKSTSKAIVGYISAMHAYGDDYWFVTNKYETAAVMKKAGCYNTATWSSDMWFARRNDKNPKNRTNPKAQFDFWKENGFKVLIGLTGIGPKQAADAAQFKAAVDSRLEFVKWIIDNGYKDVVQGFELGCETYYGAYDRQDALIKLWTALVPEILKLWPNCYMGVPVAENFELNPDIAHVRERMLAAGEIKRDTYFAAAAFNQYSAYFIMGLATNNVLDKISHVTYHTYGAETPYSCSYYGVKRIRGFAEAFPEIKDKRTWWTEIRPRSDEDNRCQRIFREALIMGHYSMMMMCQPEVDGFYHHNLCNLAGGLYISNGKSWNVQWMDEGGEYPDYDSPLNRPRMEVGAQGAVYHVIANALRSHPLLWHHGTSKDIDTEDSFYTSSRVCDQFPRLVEGQSHAYQDLFEMAWEKRCKDATGKMMDDEFEGGWQKMREDAENTCKEIKRRFWNQPFNADYGIHYDESADILWDIYQCLRYELWKNLPEPKPHYTVNAFPATQFGKEPLAKVTSKEEEK